MAKGNKWGSISGQMARIADEGRAEREASKAHEAITSKPDKAVEDDAAVKPVPVVEAPAAPKADETHTVPLVKPAPARTKASATVPKKVEPTTVVEADKAKKKSTSLYLSGAASRALHTIAAQQGVRPHRVLDDALRAEFKRHGLDFDDLNAKD